MLQKGIRYDFRKRLIQMHKPNRRDLQAVKTNDEWALPADPTP